MRLPTHNNVSDMYRLSSMYSASGMSLLPVVFATLMNTYTFKFLLFNIFLQVTFLYVSPCSHA